MRIAIILLLAVVAGAIWLFNHVVRKRNQVAVAWSDVDVQLQRRQDLVPNLVETFKGYAQHEHDLLTQVADERSAAHRRWRWGFAQAMSMQARARTAAATADTSGT